MTERIKKSKKVDGCREDNVVIISLGVVNIWEIHCIIKKYMLLCLYLNRRINIASIKLNVNTGVEVVEMGKPFKLELEAINNTYSFSKEINGSKFEQYI